MPLCNTQPQNTHHLFNCTYIRITHHVVTPGFMDRHRRCAGTAGQIDGEAGCWTTHGKIRITPPPLARVKGVGRQQQITLLSCKCLIITAHFYDNEIMLILIFNIWIWCTDVMKLP